MIVANVLLAGIQDWIGLIVPIVLFLYAMIQLLLAKAPQPQQKRPRRVPGEPVERPLNPPPPKPGEQQTQLNAEIEEFLKRAGQRRQRSQRQKEPTLKSPPKPAPRTIAAPAKTAPPPAPPPTQPREISTVSESVEKHLANRGFGQRAEHLADDIVRADAVMEEHVKSAFNRKVGRLGGAETSAPAAPVTDVEPTVVAADPATAMATLLANPQNVRQAVILNEILTRPEHRW